MSKSSIDDSEIVNITNIIKKITGRYCTFHSLRHSFATYKVDEILKHSTNNPYDLIELSMMIGHETPKITLNSYVHYDLIGLSLWEVEPIVFKIDLLTLYQYFFSLTLT